MSAKFHKNQRKTVGGVVIWKKFDNTHRQTDRHTYTVSCTSCKQHYCQNNHLIASSHTFMSHYNLMISQNINFLSVGHCKHSSILYYFLDIWCWKYHDLEIYVMWALIMRMYVQSVHLWDLQTCWLHGSILFQFHTASPRTSYIGQHYRWACNWTYIYSVCSDNCTDQCCLEQQQYKAINWIEACTWLTVMRATDGLVTGHISTVSALTTAQISAA